MKKTLSTLVALVTVFLPLATTSAAVSTALPVVKLSDEKLYSPSLFFSGDGIAYLSTNDLDSVPTLNQVDMQTDSYGAPTGLSEPRVLPIDFPDSILGIIWPEDGNNFTAFRLNDNFKLTAYIYSSGLGKLIEKGGEKVAFSWYPNGSQFLYAENVGDVVTVYTTQADSSLAASVYTVSGVDVSSGVGLKVLKDNSFYFSYVDKEVPQKRHLHRVNLSSFQFISDTVFTTKLEDLTPNSNNGNYMYSTLPTTNSLKADYWYVSGASTVYLGSVDKYIGFGENTKKWSSDGAYFYYVTGDASTNTYGVSRYNVAAQTVADYTLQGLPCEPYYLLVSPDGLYLYFVTNCGVYFASTASMGSTAPSSAQSNAVTNSNTSGGLPTGLKYQAPIPVTGSFVKYADRPEIFYSHNGMLYPFNSWPQYVYYTLISPGELQEKNENAPSSLIGPSMNEQFGETSFGTSGPCLYPDTINDLPSGTLAADGGTVFLIMGCKKIPFTNPEAFLGLGYSFKNVVKRDLGRYDLVQTQGISTSETSHTWGTWVNYNGTVYYSHKSGMMGVPSYDIFLSNGGKPEQIVPANKYDIELITNSRFRDVYNNDPFVAYTRIFHYE